ncbi:MAG TPA: TolC family protein [Rhodothermales bacterium]|nr:TolC family protein [Rhodothermales bacterium]
MCFRFAALAAALALLAPPGAHAQTTPADSIALTLDEAVEIARVRNLALQIARLDVATAEAQVREARSTLLPSAALSSSYTRNVVSANPFAGSSAGGLFSSFAFVDWLAYNERARTDADPVTNPVSFPIYQDSVRAGYDRAGIEMSSGGGNPFSVPNQFQNNISISQTLFNWAALKAPEAARRLLELNRSLVQRQEQVVADQVRQGYYGALLADAQARVVAQALERARASEREIARRVEAGTLPKFQRTTAEVQRGNLEAQLVVAENAAALAREGLRLLLDLPPDRPIALRGALETLPPMEEVDVSALTAEALARRPDVLQARIGVELRRFDREVTRSNMFPTVAAFANLGLSGSVPDNRTGVERDPTTSSPFAFRETRTGFFSSNYWQRAVSVGVRLNWTLFDGFRTRAQLQQKQIAIDRAALDVQRVEQGVRLDVERARLNLLSAQRRIASTAQNVARAEENYRIVETRLFEGVTTQLELRQASDALDQARLQYLQALYDARVARSALDTAVGLGPVSTTPPVPTQPLVPTPQPLPGQLPVRNGN